MRDNIEFVRTATLFRDHSSIPLLYIKQSIIPLSFILACCTRKTGMIAGQGHQLRW